MKSKLLGVIAIAIAVVALTTAPSATAAGKLPVSKACGNHFPIPHRGSKCLSMKGWQNMEALKIMALHNCVGPSKWTGGGIACVRGFSRVRNTHKYRIHVKVTCPKCTAPPSMDSPSVMPGELHSRARGICWPWDPNCNIAINGYQTQTWAWNHIIGPAYTHVMKPCVNGQIKTMAFGAFTAGTQRWLIVAYGIADDAAATNPWTLGIGMLFSCTYALLGK